MRKTKQFSVSRLNFLAFLTFFLTQIIFTILVLGIVSSNEKDKIKALSPKIARAIETELLLNDSEGVRIAIKRMKEAFEVRDVEFSEYKLDCSIFSFDCWVGEASVGGKSLYLKVKYSFDVGWYVLCGLVIVLCINIFVVIFYQSYFRKSVILPLDRFTNTLVPSLQSVIEGKARTLPSVDEYYVTEIHSVASTLVGMARRLQEAQERRIKVEIDLNTTQAIARTTQSLAHDVRKPFTMFKMIIDAVDGEDDPQEAKQILRESLPEVQQAMASVNGMIADVLEIGSESAPVVESANPETLIEATLNEIFRVYPDSKVNVTYSFAHKHKVSVDTLKISRVFSNIVGNAVQAMGRKGSLWFKTDEIEEDGKSFIRFCLGNGVSFIPAENISKLFDAFFTSGKKGGTGLGLAIAQKIVLAHGGKIWCESDVQRGVEFFFTLPKTVEQTDPRPHPLPTSSAAIVATFERLRGHSQSGSRVEVDPLEVSLEKEIIKLVQAMRAPLHVLIVDDEGVYRNSLAALVNRSEDLKEHLHLSFAVNSAQALEAAKTMPALVIQDVDLGKDSLNGYEVLKALRTQGFQGVVCIHSNRSLPEDYRVAVEAGADAVLPKPMSRSHFLKLALQASQRIHERLPPPAATHTSFPEFAVVDDSSLVLRAWQRKSKGQATVHTFESPDAFRVAQSADPGFLARLCFVVTDFYFAQGVTDTGLSFGQELKKVFGKPVLLSSDGEFNASDLAGCVDSVIAKDPVSWVELSTQLEASKHRS